MIDRNWIRPDGTPITGKVPPIVTVREGRLTPVSRGWVAMFYSKFCTNKRLCITGDAYFTAAASFPDGTRVRAFSVNDVDYIHIWAGDKGLAGGVGITFWCIPWDDAWIDEAFTEVFTIPRWLEIGAGTGEVSGDDFLQDLIRNELYEPPSDGLYPGNQTWFAPPPHPSAGIVVSWWGQMRRYSNSLLDQTIDAGGWWYLAGLGQTYDSARSQPGGVVGALGGRLFHRDGLSDLAPEDAAPNMPKIPAQPKVWVNGNSVPAPVPVFSAALSMIGDTAALRVVGAPTLGIMPIFQHQSDGWQLLGNINIRADVVGFAPPRSSGPSGAWSNVVDLTQPFYWNADGTEALGIVRYEWHGSYPPLMTRDGLRDLAAHVLLKIRKSASAWIAEVVAGPERHYTCSHTPSSSTTVIPPPPALPTYKEESSSVVRALEVTYTAPVAADYVGNAPKVLRTHYTLSLSSTSTEDSVLSRTVSNDTGFGSNVLVSETSSAETSLIGESALESWASVNDERIEETVRVRTGYISDVATTARAMNLVSPPYPEEDIPDPSRRSSPHYTSNRDFLRLRTHGESGVGFVWALSAGDLRGVFVLHGSPLMEYRTDFNYSDSLTQANGSTGDQSPVSGFYAGFPYPGTASSYSPPDEHTFTITPWGSCGPIFAVRPGSAEEVGDLSPLASRAGDITFVSTAGWLPGAGEYTYRFNENPEGAPYVAGAPLKVTGSDPLAVEYRGYGVSAGGHCNTIVAPGAITPDLKTQYVGAIFVAMTPAAAPGSPECFHIDKWFREGNEFTPLYPPQPDPDPEAEPGATVPFPHRGDHAILLDPIFTGPLP